MFELVLIWGRKDPQIVVHSTTISNRENLQCNSEQYMIWVCSHFLQETSESPLSAIINAFISVLNFPSTSHADSIYPLSWRTLLMIIALIFPAVYMRPCNGLVLYTADEFPLC